MADHAKTAALILAKGEPSKPDPDAHLHQAMEDLARAIHQTPPDLRGMMGAFRAACDILDCADEGDE